MTEKEIRELERKIVEYNTAYYEHDESLVSDKVYDDTVKLILDWYKDNNKDNFGPTAKVGSSMSSSKLPKVKHKSRMLSLANSYNVEEVKEFLNRYNITNWIAEQKMDGLSLSIYYKNGKLVGGATRGDGEYGEDVSISVMEIENIPHTIQIKEDMEIRGEVLIPKDVFENINKLQIEQELPVYATSRNLASGTLRQLDTSLVKKRGLRFVAYYIINPEKYNDYLERRYDLNLRYQSDILEYLSDFMGFEVPDHIMSENIQKAIDNLKDNTKYDTDGVVFKEYDTRKWTEETAKTPKWAFAYKYPTQQVQTKLLGVTWQVGRTGRITPVAELEPVVISGTLVSRATLHNMEEIRRKDIMINDVVVVEKAAEIIPQVVGPVITERSTISCIPIEQPLVCPVCGGPVTTKDSSLYCIGDKCVTQVIESITYFADRANMNIQGLGRNTVEKLFNAGYLCSIPSIYSLKQHRNALIGLDKLSSKSVDNLLAEIEKSRQNSFGKLLGALGIPRVGRTIGLQLAQTYKTWDELLIGSAKGFKEMRGLGDVVANAVFKWLTGLNDSYEYDFNNIVYSEEAKEIMALGIGMNVNTSENKLANKVFCFTGKVPITRNELQNIIEVNGGSFTSGVTMKCDYLIAGLNPTGHKIETAKKNNIKVISYEEFRKMID